jgi:hypothetical protein
MDASGEAIFGPEKKTREIKRLGFPAQRIGTRCKATRQPRKPALFFSLGNTYRFHQIN